MKWSEDPRLFPRNAFMISRKTALLSPAPPYHSPSMDYEDTYASNFDRRLACVNLTLEILFNVFLSRQVDSYTVL